MKNDLTSRRVFAETVRASHGWPDASISDADCCEYEHSAWLAWDRAWTAATQVKDAEIAALRQDKARLDYLQKRGATVEIMRGNYGTQWEFRVSGLHASVNGQIREAIDAALAQAVQPDTRFCPGGSLAVQS